MKLKLFACLLVVSAMFSLNAVTIVNNTSKVARIQCFTGQDREGESKFYNKAPVLIQPGDQYDTTQLHKNFLRAMVAFSVAPGKSIVFEEIDLQAQGTVTFTDDTIDGQITEVWS